MTRTYRRKLCTAFIVMIFLFLLGFFWNRINISNLWDDIYISKVQKKAGTKTESFGNPAFIIDTPGCTIPNLDPFDPSVKDLISMEEPKSCSGNPLFLITQQNGSISINETILELFYKLKSSNVSCTYQSIRRKYEDPGNVRENDYVLGKKRELIFGEPLDENYVVVDCKVGKDNLTQYIPIPRLIKEVENLKSSRRHIIPHLNVILVAIDSISRLNFHRHFNKTLSFLKEKLSPFEMKGYMKVGDNTFPNLITLLSGHYAEDLWNETLKDTMFFDNVTLIWKLFAERGYRTFFTEDMPVYGTFNYGKRGFHEQPTDYYYRPLALAIHQSKLRKNGGGWCLNSQTETDIMFNYLKDFIRVMGPRPYFSYVMSSSLTHDRLNNAKYADAPTANLLQHLWDSGALNDSVLFFFSDHGVRFGSIRNTYLGKFEERLPFMFIHFPAWFLRRYPHYSENLRKNQERLMTLFDVHATMVNLLEHYRELSEKEKESMTPYGVSLLSEISPYRTCDKAGIMAPWCVCQVIQQEPVDDVRVINSVNSVLSFLNENLKGLSESYDVLELDKIIEVKSGQISDLVSRFVKHENVVVNRYVAFGQKIEKYIFYSVKVLTKPGCRCFEGTVRYDIKSKEYATLHVREIKLEESVPKCVYDNRNNTLKD
ncbi:uncharacterized protein LOC129987572 [Argiope bruennichi]|uniref:DUF229 domain containing protein n=1 Tax=Argiope bruennichi TaxID=94029 RepID=A0A8T0EHT4_ARGBR|nr:uncharacterized protein LOC129987572 [Argiope bruennichi]KAF8770958.1 hypothetical protein HNY73_018425 [Argiope bruennichi]